MTEGKRNVIVCFIFLYLSAAAGAQIPLWRWRQRNPSIQIKPPFFGNSVPHFQSTLFSKGNFTKLKNSSKIDNSFALFFGLIMYVNVCFCLGQESSLNRHSLFPFESCCRNPGIFLKCSSQGLLSHCFQSCQFPLFVIGEGKK